MKNIRGTLKTPTNEYKVATTKDGRRIIHDKRTGVVVSFDARLAEPTQEPNLGSILADITKAATYVFDAMEEEEVVGHYTYDVRFHSVGGCDIYAKKEFDTREEAEAYMRKTMERLRDYPKRVIMHLYKKSNISYVEISRYEYHPQNLSRGHWENTGFGLVCDTECDL